MAFDVRMPDGTLVRNVPEGTTKEQVLAKYQASRAPAGEEVGTLESIGRGALEGATLGFADEAYGGIRSLFGDKTYEEYRDEFREEQKAAREASPFAFGAAELAGGFALPGVGTARAVGGAAKMLPKAARAAGVGAGFGGAAGAGYSEEDTVGDALSGAVLGGTIGAAVPAAGRGLQRALHRYSPEQRATRAVGAMFDEGQARKALAKDSKLMLGDLTEESRQRMAKAATADDDLFELLQTRARQASSDIVDQLPNPPKADGRLIDRTYGAIRAPRSALEGLYARNVTDKQTAKYWDNAVKAAERRLGKGYVAGGGSRHNRKFASNVIHEYQHQLRKAATGKKGSQGQSWGPVRERFLDDVRQNVNPDYVDSLAQFRREADVAKQVGDAYKRVRRTIEGKSLRKFLRDIDEQGGQMQADMRTMLGSDDAVRQFSEGLQAQRVVLEALEAAKRTRGAGSSIVRDLDGAASDIRAALGDVVKSASADRMLGVEQKLGTAAAVRRLLYTLGEHLPNLPGARGRPTATQELARMLQGREIPQYQPALAQALTRRQAALAGGAAVGSQ